MVHDEKKVYIRSGIPEFRFREDVDSTGDSTFRGKDEEMDDETAESETKDSDSGDSGDESDDKDESDDEEDSDDKDKKNPEELGQGYEKIGKSNSIPSCSSSKMAVFLCLSFSKDHSFFFVLFCSSVYHLPSTCPSCLPYHLSTAYLLTSSFRVSECFFTSSYPYASTLFQSCFPYIISIIHNTLYISSFL